MTPEPAAASITPTERDIRFDKAVAEHQAGRLAEAAAMYRELLADHPSFLPAVHGLALATAALGWPDQALPLLARCIATEPENVAYRCSLAQLLLTLGRAEAAAVAVLPAANAVPLQYEPRLLLARALGALGRWKESHATVTATTAIFPDVAALWSWQGRAARQLQRLDEAEQAWRRALTLSPEDAEILNNLGVLLRSCGRLHEAAAAYRTALSHAPDHAVCHSNLGNLLDRMGDQTNAEIHLRQALTIDPDYIDGHYNLGAHLTRLDQPEAAIPHLRRVTTAQPDRWDVLTNLGVALVALGELSEAEVCYRRAIALNPGNPEAHYDLAWLLLLTGRWHEGWAEYEWRWQMPSFSSRRRQFSAPLWDGAAVAGTLLLHAEQGIGDAIQFVRYAKLAAPLCGRLMIESPSSLVPLFNRAVEMGLLPGEIIASGDTLPVLEAQAPFMTLSRLFGTTPATVPSTAAYLIAPAQSGAELVIPNRGRRRIGLVWAGAPQNRIDPQRSMAAVLLRPLFDVTDADMVSLQVGASATETADLPADRLLFAVDGVVRDFADTAVVIAQLDLVIGVDTAVLHLTAALGKPAWMLLPAAPDYRWLATGDTTPWYPTMRLFRQPQRGDWDSVICAVSGALAAW